MKVTLSVDIPWHENIFFMLFPTFQKKWKKIPGAGGGGGGVLKYFIFLENTIEKCPFT